MYRTTSYVILIKLSHLSKENSQVCRYIYICFYVHLQPIKTSMLNNFCYTPSIKKQSPSGWSLRVGKQLERFDRPSCSSCRLVQHWYWIQLLKLIVFYVNKVIFFRKGGFQISLSTHGRILIKVWCLYWKVNNR